MTKELWQEKYKAAMVETDPMELPRKIDLANAAIHERIIELTGQHDEAAVQERHAIGQALSGLLMLRRPEGRASADAISPREPADRNVRHETHMPQVADVLGSQDTSGAGSSSPPANRNRSAEAGGTHLRG